MKKTLVGAVLLVGLCACQPVSATSDADDATATPPYPITIVQVGTPIEVEGLAITVEPLGPQKNKLVCSKVTYDNQSDADANYNLFEWHIEWPDSTRDNASPFGEDLLGSGVVQHSSKVVGNVCFPDKKKAGESAIVLDQFLGGQDPFKWYQII